MTGSEPTRPPPVVWLGDAVRASVRLQADPAVAEQVLTLLELRAPAVETPQPSTEGGLAPPPIELSTAPSRPSDFPVPTVRQFVLGQPPAELETPDAPMVEHVAPDAARASAAPRQLPAIGDVLPAPTARPPSGSDPLLPPAQQRAILSALSRSPAPTGDIDVNELVERIARREPVRSLPLALVPTTRRGVQVLVDVGDGMRPFTRDQEEVLRALERIAGPDGFEVLRFSGTPLDEPGAGPGPIWTWRSYRPPLAAQPVVVLSDLGAGVEPLLRRAVQRRWLAFAAILRAAGNQVVALAPVPVARLPAGLRLALPVLTWDRTTRVADAVLAAGRQGGRRRRVSW